MDNMITTVVGKVMDGGKGVLTKEEFLEQYNLTKELFESAEMSWEELCGIHDDFALKKSHYEVILKDFLDTYLKDVNKDKKADEEKVRIHSIRSRVKDPEHLLAKIIRKRQENYSKYKKLDVCNYEKIVRDLIGIRCLVLFKEDWQSIHYYILSKFENNVEYYIKDDISDFDEDVEHFYIAEPPKVHIRNGDTRDIYDKVLPPDSVIDGKVYRSVHYIIKYKGVYLEIQVRTLFEEGWGEIDHAVVYPKYQNDKILKEYTELLNRLSGLADEMSGFFNCLKELEIKALENTSSDDSNRTDKTKTLEAISESAEEKSEINEKKPMNTPKDCVQSVLNE